MNYSNIMEEIKSTLSPEELEQKGKEQNKNTSKKHVIHQESKRSHQRKTNP